MSDRPRPPKRRLELDLKLGADSLDELERALATIGTDLLLNGGEEREVTSGGWGSGYRLTLTCDEAMSGARYRALLAEWREADYLARKAEGEANQ